MAAVTQLLDAAAAGDPSAAAELLPLVYGELRKLAAVRLAAEPPGQTLQATALVHEAYVRLVGPAPGMGGTAAATSSPPPPRRCGGFSLNMLAEEAVQAGRRLAARRFREARC